MSVSNEAAGITTKHIGDIERTCQMTNTFLLVRPSTKETMQLIGEGYATKSMDIHDKSSDWGPASGFVPCDPAFSKALKGTPNNHPHYHEHGDAKPIQLCLTEKLATPGTNPKLVADTTQASTGDTRYVKANPSGAGPKSKTFKFVKQSSEWAVFWMDGATAVPLYVWGYDTARGVKPVTGDYDLWMVAPHIDRWSQHTQVMGIKDSHGESGATEFITWLLQKLNAECGRSDNHVFHHGAESQNYGFTQSIDPNLAMFTPGGTSEMVSIGDLPQILADMQVAGYLVYWNKRYGESDPHLMGSAVNAGVSGGTPGKSIIESLIEEAALVKEANRGTVLGEDKAQALIQKNLLGRGGEVPKIQQIQAFNKALTSCMETMEKAREGGTLKFLKPDLHIPQTVLDNMVGDVEGLNLQKQLQRAVMDLSEMDYGYGKSGPTHGATLAPSPEKWKNWAENNRPLFQKLTEKYGDMGPVTLRFDRITGTRAYQAKQVPVPPIPQPTLDKVLGDFFGDLFTKIYGWLMS